MDAITFNKIDKINEKLKALSQLDMEKRILLLESQINAIYYYWNDSIEKTNGIMANNSCINLDEKIIFYDLLLSQSVWTNKKIDYPKSENKQIYQWGIFYCDLGYNIGSEQNKRRPVLVINDTSFVNSSIVLIAPISGNGKNVYKHEVVLLETAYNKINGKIDLSHIRAVSKSRLDGKPIDRLLTVQEYEKKYTSKNYTTIQSIVQSKLKTIFGIA